MKKITKDINGVEYDIFNLPKNKSLVFDIIFLDNMGLRYLPDMSTVESNHLVVKNNMLVSLKGCPKKLRILDCQDNLLTSLEGCPQDLVILNCKNNKIKDLNYCPENLVRLFCSKNQISNFGNNEFKSLKWLDITSNIITIEQIYSIMNRSNILKNLEIIYLESFLKGSVQFDLKKHEFC